MVESSSAGSCRTQTEPSNDREEDAQILLPVSLPLRYSGLEVLLPSVQKCVWEQKDLHNLHKVQVYPQNIQEMKNCVRRRALHRLSIRNGHFYIDTLESAKK